MSSGASSMLLGVAYVHTAALLLPSFFSSLAPSEGPTTLVRSAITRLVPSSAFMGVCMGFIRFSPNPA